MSSKPTRTSTADMITAGKDCARWEIINGSRRWLPSDPAEVWTAMWDAALKKASPPPSPKPLIRIIRVVGKDPPLPRNLPRHKQFMHFLKYKDKRYTSKRVNLEMG